MKSRIITLFFILNAHAYVKTIEATYEISYGIFGKLGEAKTTLSIIDNTRYNIKVHAYATGFAKVLSSGKEETYESTGTIVNNQFLPQKFIKHSNTSYKKRFKEYTFDHEKQQIRLFKREKRLKTHYNAELKPIQKWHHKQSYDTNAFFTQNDLLSLFFNIKQLVPHFDQGCNYKMKAIGANSQNGAIDIFVPQGKKYQQLNDALQTNDTKFIAAIHQKIFSSAKGELFISLNKEGFCNKAVLKDVLIFGDIIGEITEFNIKES
jgi:hypothetical protein